MFDMAGPVPGASNSDFTPMVLLHSSVRRHTEKNETKQKNWQSAGAKRSDTESTVQSVSTPFLLRFSPADKVYTLTLKFISVTFSKDSLCQQGSHLSGPVKEARLTIMYFLSESPDRAGSAASLRLHWHRISGMSDGRQKEVAS